MTAIDFSNHPVLEKQPLFWERLHLRTPSKFVFGDEFGLILTNQPAMRTIQEMSNIIHGKSVLERNAAFRRAVANSKNVTTDEINDFINRILNATSGDSDTHILFHHDAISRIIELTAAGADPWGPLDLKIKITDRIRRVCRKNAIRIGNKALDALGKRFVEFLTVMIVQIWHLKTSVFVNEYIPSAEEFFRDPVGRSECFDAPRDMFGRLARNEITASIVQQIIHCESPYKLFDVLFDTELAYMFPPSFKTRFSRFLVDFQQRVAQFDQKKCDELRKLPINEPLSIDQILPLICAITGKLINEEHLTMAGEEWAVYMREIVGKLVETVPPPAELEMEQQREQFDRVLISGNLKLCAQLAPVYETDHVEEKRCVLAHMLRFLLKFAVDLIRHCFHVKIDKQRGKLVEIRYNGQFEQVGHQGVFDLFEDREDILGEVFRSPGQLKRQEESRRARNMLVPRRSGLTDTSHEATGQENALAQRAHQSYNPTYHAGWYPSKKSRNDWTYAKPNLAANECSMILQNQPPVESQQQTQDCVPPKKSPYAYGGLYRIDDTFPGPSSAALTSSAAATSSTATMSLSARAENLVASLNAIRESRPQNRADGQRPLRRPSPAPIRLPTQLHLIPDDEEEDIDKENHPVDNNTNVELPPSTPQRESESYAIWMLYPEIAAETDPNEKCWQ